MSDRGPVTVDGGALRGAVDALCCADLGELAVAELQQLAAAVTSARSRLAGVEAVVLGALDVRAGGKVASAPGPDGAPGPSVLVQHWWRDTTGLGGPSAGRDVRVSQALRSLPRVLAAVLDGTVGMAQATVLTRLVGQVDAAALAEAEPALIQVAAERDPHALGLHVSHLLATWCEPQFEADERSQEARRYLQTSREPDGMLSGRFRLTRKDSEPFLSLIEPLARPSGLAEGRSVGQRRADALVECCEQVLRFGELGDAGGVRPHVAYVMPAGWAAGQPVCGSFADLVAAGLPTDHGLDIPGAACPGRPDGRGGTTVRGGTPARGGTTVHGVRSRSAARSGRGRARRPAATSSRSCATPASPGSCSTGSDRSRGSRRSARPSPTPSGRPCGPATAAAPSAAAPARRRSATPTTSTTGPTAARTRSTTWSCSAVTTTPSGTRAASPCDTCTSRGSPGRVTHRSERGGRSMPRPR